jgi:hypothetical protein
LPSHLFLKPLISAPSPSILFDICEMPLVEVGLRVSFAIELREPVSKQ